jgi:preprotein translocase subunit SecY
MIQSIRNAFSLPDLRGRILFTLFILVIYRLAANIPVPGANAVALSSLAQFTFDNPLIQTLNLLSGGAVTNFSVMAMGVYPYITASIIIQLLTPIIPYLEELQSEGESGRNKINRITYYLTVPLALVQAVGQINLIGLQYQQLGGVQYVMPRFGFGSVENILPTIMILLAMTAGTMFAIWLGELITSDGIGQGVSLIIFSGIVTGIPANLLRISGIEDTLSEVFAWAAFIVLTVVTTLVVVVIQEGQRRLPVQYGRRVRGRKTYQGQSTYIPMKVNTAGMIPIIFAQSIIAFPGILGSVFINSETAWLRNFALAIDRNFGSSQGFWYWFIYFIFVVAFTFFYTDVLVAQQDLHNTLQRQGGFIPGIRPGTRTRDYIKSVVRRITTIGAIFLGIVAILPGLMGALGGALGLQQLDLSALVISGSGLIIVVGVVIDTMRQLEAQLLMRNYEGFIK